MRDWEKQPASYTRWQRDALTITKVATNTDGYVDARTVDKVATVLERIYGTKPPALPLPLPLPPVPPLPLPLPPLPGVKK